MKKVKILANSIQHGPKIFGKDGHYAVEDSVARLWAQQGKARIVEDLGSDYEPEPVVFKDEWFLQKLRDHRAELYDLMEQESKKRSEERRTSENEPVEVNISDETGTPDDTSSPETENTGNNTDDQNKDAGENDASDEIPEIFPGREALISAGYDTLTKVKALASNESDLTNVAGIGDKKAAQIISKLNELG